MDIFKREYNNTKDNIVKYLYENGYLNQTFYMHLNPYVDFDMVVKYRKDIPYIYLFSSNLSLINDDRFIERYGHLLSWDFVSIYITLTREKLEKYDKILDWKTIWANPTIIPFLEDYKDHIYFPRLSENIALTEELIDRYKGQLNWKYLSQKFPFTVELVEKYEDNINWFCLNRNYNIDEKVITTYKNRFDLKNISSHNVSLSFVEENFELLNPYYISGLPILSEEFISKHIDSLEMYQLCSNPCFTQRLIEKYDWINGYWYHIGKNPNIDLDFINKYKNKIDTRSLGYNSFLYDDKVFKDNIKVDLDSRREKVLQTLDIVNDVKDYILKFYIGYN